ncbi:hypothetical protein RhiJN_11494 [Ceratobasidium sp. AG-Ba]|nr:hypothetical protein RhiJN_11494 [Ceratobasidium sp. AG-Ba]QRW12209.1 hypothetical protein RhiLY_11208 [Ceratobasidium sp. AG-Ba]
MELSEDESAEIEPSQDGMDYDNGQPEEPASPAQPKPKNLITLVARATWLLIFGVWPSVPFEQLEPSERSPGAQDIRSSPEIEVVGAEIRGAELDENMDDHLSQDDNAHIDHDYRFDHLLDDAYNDYQNQPLLEYMGDPFPEEEGHGVGDAMDNEDFGLPDGQGDHQGQPAAFRFDIDEDLLEEQVVQADDDLEGVGEGAGDQYWAFNEHEPIRNAYIDAFVQKTVFGATHRAINHQLRAACRTISANPNVPPEDIASMAQTVMDTNIFT